MLGFIVIIGSTAFSFYFQTGYIVNLLGLSVGALCSIFPILLNYRQLTHVVLKNDECISYSFLHKKLCVINLKEDVYYSLFYVRFSYAPKIQFIALSNESFSIAQSSKNLMSKSFYGEYNQKKIIILPYDEHIFQMIQKGTNTIANANDGNQGRSYN